MSVKITELPILDSLADNDIVAGVDVSGNVTSKIEMSTLKNYIDTNTQYTAGTNIDITNNVISAPDVYNKEEADEKIEELQNEVDSLSTIFNAFPTESGEGESLTLDDTAEVKFKKFDLKGNTSQYTTTGKQLFDNSLMPSSATRYNNGFTLLKSTNRTLSVRLPKTYEAGTYTLSDIMVNKVTTISPYFLMTIQYWDGSTTSPVLQNIQINNNASTTFTVSSQFNQIYFFISSSESDNATITIDNVMLQTGSSATNYEPYTNGASPNPDYPQDVNVVSGDNEILINGKNWFDKNNIQWYRNNINTFSDKTDTSTTRIRTSSFRIQGGKTYTISGLPSGISFLAVRTYTIPSGDSTSHATVNGNTFTLQDDVNYIHLLFGGSNFTSDTNTLMKNANIMLNEGSSALPYEPYIGNTYNIDLPVENLFDKDNANILNASFSGEKSINSSPNAKTLWVKCKPNTTYIIKKIQNARFRVATSTNEPVIGGTTLSFTYDDSATSLTITTENNANYILIYYFLNGTDTLSEQTILDSISIANGSVIGTPIELCKIGNYQDYFYKDNGNWYKYGFINKVINDGTESWSVGNTGTNKWYYYRNLGSSKARASDGDGLSNYYPFSEVTSNNTNKGIFVSNNGYLRLRYGTEDTTDNYKTWLSSNNVLLYYVLATPTITQITYQPLIDQLNALEKATSYENQTNISQVNNDKPFILDVTAIKSLQSVLDRIELLES